MIKIKNLLVGVPMFFLGLSQNSTFSQPETPNLEYILNAVDCETGLIDGKLKCVKKDGIFDRKDYAFSFIKDMSKLSKEPFTTFNYGIAVYVKNGDLNQFINTLPMVNYDHDKAVSLIFNGPGSQKETILGDLKTKEVIDMADTISKNQEYFQNPFSPNFVTSEFSPRETTRTPTINDFVSMIYNGVDTGISKSYEVGKNITYEAIMTLADFYKYNLSEIPNSTGNPITDELNKAMKIKLKEESSKKENIETKINPKSYQVETKKSIWSRLHIGGKKQFVLRGMLSENGKLYISSGYGLRKNPFSIGMENHPGWDVFPANWKITPALSGVVLIAGHLDGYGNCVVVNHKIDNEEYQTYYGHMYETLVVSGQKVDENTVLGYMGSTGRSNGNHEHFEIRKKINGFYKPVDPGPLTTIMDLVPHMEKQPYKDSIFGGKLGSDFFGIFRKHK